MTRTALWKLVLCIGIFPLAAPVVTGLYHMAIERWSLLDWLILYSFLYWPTYVLGIMLIALAAVKLRK